MKCLPYVAYLVHRGANIEYVLLLNLESKILTDPSYGERYTRPQRFYHASAPVLGVVVGCKQGSEEPLLANR